MSDERIIDTPPAGSDAWETLWRENHLYRPEPATSLTGRFYARVRRMVRRALFPDYERQRDYNLVLLDLIRDARAHAEALRDGLGGDIGALQRDIQQGDSALSRDVSRIEQLVPVAARRNDALIAALDQKIEMLSVRVRDLSTPLLEGAAASPSLRDDFLYRRLEDGLRGSESEIRDAVQPYVELARTHQPLLDAGCGRGELLVACREEGIVAKGFDTNERSIADLQARGFDVALAPIPQCFATYAAGSVGSIMAMHVVEHLPVDALFALFAEAARVLRPGGLLMIETPNAESLMVSGSEFWRDPTHLAPRHPASLTLLAREYGFTIDEIRPVHPFPDAMRIAVLNDDPPALQRVVDAVNDRLFGPQDLRMILRRAE